MSCDDCISASQPLFSLHVCVCLFKFCIVILIATNVKHNILHNRMTVDPYLLLLATPMIDDWLIKHNQLEFGCMRCVSLAGLLISRSLSNSLSHRLKFDLVVPFLCKVGCFFQCISTLVFFNSFIPYPALPCFI